MQKKVIVPPLSAVCLKGTVFDDYAYIRLEYIYAAVNNRDGQIRHIFSTPSDAVFKSLRIIGENGGTASGKMMTEAQARELFKNGDDIKIGAVISRLSETAWQISMENRFEGQVKVLVDFYTQLQRRGKFLRFCLPVTVTRDFYIDSEFLKYKEVCEMSVSIEFAGSERILKLHSPSHAVDIVDYPTYKRVVCEGIPMVSDFAVDAEYEENPINRGYIVKTMSSGGYASYTLYPKNTNPPMSAPKRMKVLLNNAVLKNAESYALARRILQALSQYSEIEVISTEDISGDVEYPVSVLGNGRVADGFAELFISHCACVFITAGVVEEEQKILDFVKDQMPESRLQIYSVGRHAYNGFLYRLAESASGSVCLVYPDDNVFAVVSKEMNSFLTPPLNGVSIAPHDGIVSLFFPTLFKSVRSGEGVRIFTRFDVMPPLKFSVTADFGRYKEVIVIGEETELSRDDRDFPLKRFSNFTHVTAVFEIMRIRELTALMDKASPASWRKIKDEINDICIRNEILLGEIVMTAVIDGKTCPIDIRSGAPLEYKKDDKKRGKLKDLYSSEFSTDICMDQKELCNYILKNQRKDGAFCGLYEIDSLMRADTTALCIIAVIMLTDDPNRYKDILSCAAGYLIDAFSDSGILTESALTALSMCDKYGIVEAEMLNSARNIICGASVPDIDRLRKDIRDDSATKRFLNKYRQISDDDIRILARTAISTMPVRK